MKCISHWAYIPHTKILIYVYTYTFCVVPPEGANVAAATSSSTVASSSSTTEQSEALNKSNYT